MNGAPFAAEARTVGELFRWSRFRPAAVQRSFEWTPDDVERLLGDIDAVFAATWDPTEAPSADDELLIVESGSVGAPDLEPYPAEALPDAYYIGSFVLRPLEDGEWEIFDGLQRITTLTVVLAVLRDLEDDPAAWVAAHDLVMEASGPRLALGRRDTTLVEHVQHGGATLRQRGTTAKLAIGKRIQAVKNRVLKVLEPWDPSRRRAFATFLRRRVFTCVVQVAEPQMARQIFVSTNLFGKRLDPVDLLKGQLADVAATEAEADDVVELWKRLEDQVSDFPVFLRAVDAMTRRTVQLESWPTDLGHHVADAARPGYAGRWMFWVARLANRWREMAQIRVSGGRNGFEQDLWRLRVFPWPEWHPVALWMFDRYELATPDEQEQLERMADRLHRRCMAASLCGFSDGDRRKIFMRAMAQLADGRDPTTKSLALTFKHAQRLKMERTLTSQLRDFDVVRSLLLWLEGLEWRPGLSDRLHRSSVEHVLPRNPPAAVMDAPDFRPTEYDDDCYALGNLAVIPREVNERLSNSSFAEKRAALAPLAPEYRTVPSVVDVESWTSAEIRARTEQLVLEVWRGLGLTRPGDKASAVSG